MVFSGVAFKHLKLDLFICLSSLTLASCHVIFYWRVKVSIITTSIMSYYFPIETQCIIAIAVAQTICHCYFPVAALSLTTLYTIVRNGETTQNLHNSVFCFFLFFLFLLLLLFESIFPSFIKLITNGGPQHSRSRICKMQAIFLKRFLFD